MRKIILYLLVGTTLLTLSISLSYYFRVREITVEGTKQLFGTEVYSNKSMFFLKKEDIEREILAKNPSLQKVTVQLAFPQSIVISVIPSAPIASLLLKDGIMQLSSKGKIIAKQKDLEESSHIPVQYYQPLYYRNFTVGEIIDIGEVVTAVFIIEEVQKLNIPISTVDIRNENMIVLISEEREILVSATKDARVQIAQLKVVIEQFRAKALTFSRLDLRFEKPVVVFEK